MLWFLEIFLMLSKNLQLTAPSPKKALNVDFFTATFSIFKPTPNEPVPEI